MPGRAADHYDAGPFVPRSTSLKALATAAAGCRGCPLWQPATQTVFGSGPAHASLILVGEQPSDVEDRKGRPFVGPAGAVLWQCVEEVGIDRDALYVTNAVKHFKFTERGKRRLHQRPDAAEIEACHPWLVAELEAVPARVVVALGAVAARSLFGRPMPIVANRGTTFTAEGRTALITYHPSAVLRADERADEVRAALIEDLRLAQRLAAEAG